MRASLIRFAKFAWGQADIMNDNARNGAVGAGIKIGGRHKVRSV